MEAAIAARNRWRAANVVNGGTPANGSSSSRAVAAKGASTPGRSGALGGEFAIPFSGEPTREAALARGSGGQEEIRERSGLDPLPSDEEWPLPGSTLVKRGVNRRLTLAPILPSSNPQRGWTYYPTTKGGKQLARIRFAEDIRLHLFSPEIDTSMEELDEACNRLEASMEKMSQVQLGQVALFQGNPNSGVRQEVEDDMTLIDSRFDHSWTSTGPGPGLDWF